MKQSSFLYQIISMIFSDECAAELLGLVNLQLTYIFLVRGKDISQIL